MQKNYIKRLSNQNEVCGGWANDRNKTNKQIIRDANGGASILIKIHAIASVNDHWD